MAKRVAELSAVAKEILEVLKGSDKPMTLAEVKEVVPTANSAHLTALGNRGLVGSEKVEKEVVTVAKRKVNEYTALDAPTEDAE